MGRVWKAVTPQAGAQVRDLAAANVSGAPSDEAAGEGLRTQIETLLTDLLAQETKLPRQSIEPSELLTRYGIDSLAIMNVTERVEKITGELPKTLFFECATLRELADVLARKYGQAFASATSATSSTPERQVEAPRAARSQDRPAARVHTGGGAHTSSTRRGAGAELEPIAIIGIHGRYPQADNLDELWQVLAEGRDCIREVPRDRWNADALFDPLRNRPGKSYSKWGGFMSDIAGFDHTFFGISRSEADFLDPQERLWLETAWHTFEDAGYTPRAVRDRAVGVFVGVMSGMYQKLRMPVNGGAISPFGSSGSIANRTSYQLDLKGPSMAIDSMCSSSHAAIHLGCESLWRGESDMVLAGGVNTLVHPDKYVTQSQSGWFSSDGRCRSFGKGGDGYVPGEGVGAVLLKRLSEAERDGDRIYALIRGTALNHCGRTHSYFVPNPNAQAEVMQRAWTRAGVEPRNIGCFEAHGTGTSLGDPVELRGITKAFSESTSDRHFCALGSVKSNVGHLESAAGIAALSKVVLQLTHRTLVPSLHGDPPNPHLALDEAPVYLQTQRAPWPVPNDGSPRLAAISSFGAGGTNAHLVVEEYTGEALATPDDGSERVVLLSAADKPSLRQYVERWVTFLTNSLAVGEGSSLADIAHTTIVGRTAMRARLAAVVRSREELLDVLSRYLNGSESGSTIWSGEVTQGSTESSLLDDAEGAEIVQMFAERGYYKKLAQLWTLSSKVDFAELALTGGRRTYIPLYPFQHVRCWVPEVEEDQPTVQPRIETAQPERETAELPTPPQPTSARPIAPRVPAGAASQAKSSKIANEVIDMLARVSPMPKSEMQASRRLFVELGFDSLMIARCSSELMGKYPMLKLEASLYSLDTTVADLIKIVSDQVEESAAVTTDSQVAASDAGSESIEEAQAPSSSHTVFDDFEEVVEARRKRSERERYGLVTFSPQSGPNGVTLEQDGRSFINFTTYDHLGLSAHQRPIRAARAAVKRFGSSVSASRPVGGEIPLYREFEHDLAAFIGCEDASLFVSGHAPNANVMGVLAGAEGLVLLFENASGAITDGALASGAEALVVPDGDLDRLDELLTEVRGRYRRVVVAVEAIAERTGAIADLPRLVALKQRHQVFLLVDESASFGVLGRTGRGLSEHYGINPQEVDVISCGLGRALGSSGGFVAGRGPLVHFMRCTAPSLMFATAVPPMSVAAAHAALKVLQEEPERVAQVQQQAALLRDMLRAAGFTVTSDVGAVVTLAMANDARCLQTAAHLQTRGVAVEYHLAQESGGAPRLSMAVVAAHTQEQLQELVTALEEARDGESTLQAAIPAHETSTPMDPRFVRDPASLGSYTKVGAAPAPQSSVCDFPEYQALMARQAAVPPGQGLFYRPHEGKVTDSITVAGKSTINFATFNYLGLAGHDRVITAVERAVARYGGSASSPRHWSGTLDVHQQLERALASFLGAEDAVVFDAGHTTNVTALGGLFGPGDLILQDGYAHNSMVQGMLFSGAKRQPFRHNDHEQVDALLSKLRGHYRRVCIAIEGAYSQDGDLPDLAKFIEVKKRHGALLFVDEAHSIGAVGATGRGIVEHTGVPASEVDILMGTLSKGLGSSGGYVAGSAALVEYLRQTPHYRSNANLSPAVAAAAIEALRVIVDHPEKLSLLRARSEQFRELAQKEGLDTGLSANCGVIPIMTYNSQIAYMLSFELFQHGITAYPFTYPVVPEKESRLRLFVNCEHSPEQIERSVKCIAALYRKLKATVGQPTLAAAS